MLIESIFVSIHAPIRSEGRNIMIINWRKDVSIHAPIRSEGNYADWCGVDFQFQSTPLYGAKAGCDLLGNMAINVSIHAPIRSEGAIFNIAAVTDAFQSTL